jgi:hypothetical protein
LISATKLRPNSSIEISRNRMSTRSARETVSMLDDDCREISSFVVCTVTPPLDWATNSVKT